MNSQLFFFLNLLAGLAFLAWFFSSRRDGPRKPTRLRMKDSNAAPNAPPRPATPMAPAVAKGGEKMLNVLFMYNGHDWDAYEVLGLPAGTGLTLVTQRYQDLIRNAEGGQLEFFEAAYQAILKRA